MYISVVLLNTYLRAHVCSKPTNQIVGGIHTRMLPNLSREDFEGWTSLLGRGIKFEGVILTLWRGIFIISLLHYMLISVALSNIPTNQVSEKRLITIIDNTHI